MSGTDVGYGATRTQLSKDQKRYWLYLGWDECMALPYRYCGKFGTDVTHDALLVLLGYARAIRRVRY
eukprot:164693-Rhodomonas_salina.2